MMWVAENIQACLRIFRRAQHLWLARDILHLPQGVFDVFVLWPTRPIRLIRLIRGRGTIDRTGNSPPGKGYLCGSRGAYFLLPTAAILFSGGLEGPARQVWELRHRAAAKTRLEQRPMTEGPRRYASQAPRNFLISFLSTGLIRPIRGRKRRTHPAAYCP